jgi:putative metallohydrolase (TIGR04338 family)
MKRDNQRSKVYLAENKALHMFADEKLFGSMEELKLYCINITESDYWKKHKGWKRFTVSDGRGRRSACYKPTKKQLCFPKDMRTPEIAIHEMSHFLTAKTSKGVPNHGSHFCGHYLNLVNELLGSKAFESLKEAFDEGGVKYKLHI